MGGRQKPQYTNIGVNVKEDEEQEGKNEEEEDEEEVQDAEWQLVRRICCSVCCILQGTEWQLVRRMPYTSQTFTLTHTHTATYCNIVGLPNADIHCDTMNNTPKHTAAHCSALQHTLQHAATRCNTIREQNANFQTYAATLQAETRCNTLQHIATHCNTLQHTATHCNSWCVE